MDIEAVPPVDPSGQRAVIEALERAGVRVVGAPVAYESSWSAAGRRDVLEVDELEDYTPSPRSTRGATRA